MKKAEIAKSMNDLLSRTGFQLKKHSPEILIVAGVISVVTSVAMACKATAKVDKVVEDTKNDIDKAHTATTTDAIEVGGFYSAEDSKGDLILIHVRTEAKFAELHGPSVVLGTLLIIGILTSNNILRKRNVALGVAHAVIDKGSKEYRSHVIEGFGEEADRGLKCNFKAKKSDETIIDEKTGEEEKAKRNGLVVSLADINGYVRFFEKYMQDGDGNSILDPHWEGSSEYNLISIKAQERYANDLLKAKKRVFLNEVYEMLGLLRIKTGQIVGWVYDSENSGGDNHIGSGLYSNDLSYSDHVSGFNQAILLDFNVDGGIWDLM